MAVKISSKLGGLFFAAAFAASTVSAGPPGSISLADEQLVGTMLLLQPKVGYESASLRISGPESYALSKSFDAGVPISVDLVADAEPSFSADGIAARGTLKTAPGEVLPDGKYHYEVVFSSPKVAPETHTGSFFVDGTMLFSVAEAKTGSNPSEPLSSNESRTGGVRSGIIKSISPDDAVNVLDTAGDDNTHLSVANDGGPTWFFNNQNGGLFLSNTSGVVTFPISALTNGNVGFGTTSPQKPLHVISTGNPDLRLQTSGAAYWELESNNGFFDINQNGSRKLTLNSIGDMGIGTAVPGVPVHVFRSGGNAAEIRSQTTGGSVTPRRALYLLNNGDPLLRLENTASASQWDFRTTSGGFSITRVGTGQLEAEVQNDGDFSIAGSYLTHSSRSVKDNIVEVDGETVLAKLESLPIAEWSYSRNLSQRHVGPMAEDFHATFGLGPDNRHVTPTDLAGVALAAAKALKAENAKLRAEVLELKGIEARLDRLERRLRIGR